ncbi:hypothetical protein MKEN_01258400 [Mycena kentingensis (nom. inval.)]|nr:hypothetical protein MKEN_01258400 [Mycena kentingensis (nom. inval.)]
MSAVASPALIISSPKSPRSTHRRSSSTQSSPRHNRVRSHHSPRSTRNPPPEQDLHPPGRPNYDGPPQPGFVPDNLHETEGLFTADPTTGAFAAGGDEHQPEVPPAGSGRGRRFVGGFVGSLKKKAWRQRGRPDDPEALVAYPAPVVVHDGERQYAAVPGGDPDERRYASPERYASPVPEAATSAHNAELYPIVERHYAEEYEQAPGHERKQSSTSTDTMHQTQEHYEGTTIVNHEPVMYGSPPYVEPQPGPDYAKIEPPPSEASFGSYLARAQRFLKSVNDLPWIAQDRVTVDYIPKGAREQMAQEEAMSNIGSPMPPPAPRPRSGVARRTTVSWYNSQGPIDLLAGSSPRPLNEFGQPMPKEGFVPAHIPQVPPTQYPYTSPGAGTATYGTNTPILVAATPPRPSPKPMVGALGPNTPRSGPGTPRRVPPPRYDPDFDGPPGTGTYRMPGSPRYAMGGYIPHEQLQAHGMPQAQSYAASTVSSMAQSARRPS